MRQLGLDGTNTTHPPPRWPRLTDRQRELLAYVRATGDVRPRDIGRLMHRGRVVPWCACSWDEDAYCRYASSDGVDALRRLARRGLVDRVERGRWHAVVGVEDWPGP